MRACNEPAPTSMCSIARNVARPPAAAATTASARARDDDRASGPGELDRLRERFGRLGRDVDHDVGETAGLIPQGAYRIDHVDIDCEIRTELGRDGEPRRVARAAARD